MIESLGTDIHKGITTESVDDRRYQYGTNIREDVPPKGFCAIWIGTLDDFTLKILLISALISIVANVIVEEDHREIAWVEGFAILVAVFLSSTVQSANDV